MNRKISQQQSLRINSLSQKVFYIIAAIIKDAAIGTLKLGEAYVNLLGGKEMYDFCHRFNGVYYPQAGRGKKIKKEWEVQKVIKYLAQRKYIKLDGEQQKIYLAKKGIVEFIKFKTIQKQGKWDGKWRIIIFDVAEERRNNRDFLRTRLKWLGFKELQKSVWIFPYDIKKDVEELIAISKYNSEGDIRFLTVEKIEEDDDLKKWFDLK
jgi:hypothetical protein